MIYLDNAATTKVCESAISEMVKYSRDSYFNPSAIYEQGIENLKAIDSAKKLIADKLGVEFRDNIIFTGSATEANNLAILGSVKKSFKRLIFSQGEHPAVYFVAKHLLEQGFDVVFVKLQGNGEIDYDDLEKNMTPDTSFISIIHVNNETGAINDLKRISALRDKLCPRALLHCDGVQAFGKIGANIDALKLDFYTFSAHKLHGPKGVAGLYVRNKNKLSPIVYGGGQEYGIRSGTENVAGIMGFKAAIEELRPEDQELVRGLRNEFLEGLKGLNFKINAEGSPYILSLSFKGLRGETIVHALEEKGVLISTGSACSSSKKGNRILEAMGRSASEILGSIRISFSKFNTTKEVREASQMLKEVIERLEKI